MVLSSEILETIENVIDLFEHNVKAIPLMIDQMCDLYPNVNRAEFGQELAERFGAVSKSGSTLKIILRTDIEEAKNIFGDDISSMVEYLQQIYPNIKYRKILTVLEKELDESTKTTAIISKKDIDDALLMGDKQSAIDYLLEIYQNLTYNQIESELKWPTRASSKSPVRVSYNPLRKGTPKPSRRGTFIIPPRRSSSKLSRRGSPQSKKAKRKITEADVHGALERFAFKFGPNLKDKIIKYMSREYPELSQDEIINQLSTYDFDLKVMTSPEKKSDSSRKWTLCATPPPAGKTYQPSDFSPSSMGACSTAAMDFLRDKRSTYLPGYVSPPRTPHPTPLRTESGGSRTGKRRLSFETSRKSSRSHRR